MPNLGHRTTPDGSLTAEQRAAKWDTFILLRTVLEQSASSLRTEALLKLDELETRVREAEALGDA